MEKQNAIDIKDFNGFTIRMPEYKTFKADINSINSVTDLAMVVFAIIGGDSVRLDINSISDDRKSILEKYFIEV